MKIKVFNEQSTEERTLRLRLRENYDGGVTLIAVDELGNIIPAGNLVEIRPSGKLYLCGAVNRALGLDLDFAGFMRRD